MCNVKEEVGTIVDKPREEQTVKAEPSSASSYMTREQDNKNNNVNPFVTDTEFLAKLYDILV